MRAARHSPGSGCNRRRRSRRSPIAIPVEEPLSASSAATLERLLWDNVAGRMAWFMAWLVVAVVEPCEQRGAILADERQQELEDAQLVGSCQELYPLWHGELLGGTRDVEKDFEKWRVKLEGVQRFRSSHDGQWPEQKAKDQEEKTLGSWLDHQRTALRNKVMPKRRADELRTYLGEGATGCLLYTSPSPRDS